MQRLNRPLARYTGLHYKAVRRLRECCRQVEAELADCSRNKIYQTWKRPYSGVSPVDCLLGLGHIFSLREECDVVESDDAGDLLSGNEVDDEVAVAVVLARGLGAETVGSAQNPSEIDVTRFL